MRSLFQAFFHSISCLHNQTIHTISSNTHSESFLGARNFSNLRWRTSFWSSLTLLSLLAEVSLSTEGSFVLIFDRAPVSAVAKGLDDDSPADVTSALASESALLLASVDFDRAPVS